MPANFDYRTHTTEIRCSRCNTAHEITEAGRYVHQLDGTEVSARDGASITSWLRWLPARNRYHAWCRSCEREARAAAPRRPRQPRVPGTRGIPARFDSRKFGVELELTFPSHVSRHDITAQLQAAGLDGWRVKSDCSIRGNGWEIVSPPLQGEAGMDALQIATRVLRRLGADTNRSTGLHIHHEITDLSIASVKQLAKGWSDNQPLLDGLVAPRGAAAPAAAPTATRSAARISAGSTPATRWRSFGTSALAATA